MSQKVFAATSNVTATLDTCSPYGYTVAFINGVFKSQIQAKASASALQLVLGNEYKGEPIYVELAYNTTHIAGIGDMVQAVSQLFFAPLSDFDLRHILTQLSEIDTTQKLTIVGHSQGALYANAVHQYLVESGQPMQSFNVYAVGTPSHVVAGGGKYVNGDEDAVVIASMALAEKLHKPLPLSSNVHLYGIQTSPSNLMAGHSFFSYIAGARDKIIADIHQGFNSLETTSVSEVGRCIKAPSSTLSDDVQKLFFSVVDPVASAVKVAVVAGYKSVAMSVASVVAVMQTGYGLLGSVTESLTEQVANTNSNPFAPQNQEKNFEVMKKLYGSSIDMEMYEELNPKKQTTVVVQAPTRVPVLAVVPAPSTSVVIIESAEGVERPVATSSQIQIPPNPITYFFGAGGNAPTPPSQLVLSSDSSSQPNAEDLLEATSTESVIPGDTIAASTSPEIVETSTSTDEVASPPLIVDESTTTPPQTQAQLFSDTFDSFNSAEWQVYGQQVKLFDFDAGSQGACVKGGCVVGVGEGVDGSFIPRMYGQTDSGMSTGAYTLYAKVRAGFSNPDPAIILCITGSVDCAAETQIGEVSFNGFVPTDDMWHQYYFAWRQGTTTVQSCLMRDDVQPEHCTWEDSDLPTGTTFNGIVLMSTVGWRADISPYANVWFDELTAVVAGEGGE